MRCYPLRGLIPCCPVCHLPPALVSHGFPATVTPPFLFPWAPPVADAWRFQLNVASFSCHLAVKRSAASRTPRWHLPARVLSCNGAHLGLHPKDQLGVFRGPLVASNAFGVVKVGICANSSIVHPVSGPPHRSSSRASPVWVNGPRFVVPRPPRREPTFTECRSDALASCLLEGLRVRNGGVAGTLSALEANDSQEDSVVRRSAPSEVLRAEGPRHPPVEQSQYMSNTPSFSIRPFRLRCSLYPD